MNTFQLGEAATSGVTFQRDGGRVWTRRLFGMACGNCGEDTGPIRTQGPAVIFCSLGRLEGGDFTASEAAFTPEAAVIVWTAVGGAIRLESRWSLYGGTGVLRRSDTLTNAGTRPITLHRCLARFAFPPGEYEAYTQDSRWCGENQGEWTPLRASETTLRCEGGRTTQSATPYACIREAGGRTGLAFHIVPCGNWTIRLARRPAMSAAYATVELGMDDEDLCLVMAPGQAVELPDILIQELPEGRPELAAPALHRYVNLVPPPSVLARLPAGQLGGADGETTSCGNKHPQADSPKSEPKRPDGSALRFDLGVAPAPVVYNTWFDQFEILDVPGLRRQLAAAKEIGCEVLTIDAGWFGAGEGDWFRQAGDWREKTSAAFAGRMADFADEVRAAGLGFGLWMEPERFGPDAPIRRQRPEWFLPRGACFARIDLENPAAYEYQKSEILRLAYTYSLAWMKIDFNFELGQDETGAALAGYYRAWCRMLDEVRAACPGMFLEGCASGGMRSDLSTMAHFGGHFLSDTVNPLHTLRIGQGAMLRLPPGRLCRWAVLRSAGRCVPQYCKQVAESAETLITPGGAGWVPSETMSIDFAVLAALPGMLGLSGDIEGLPVWARQRLAEHVAFYKQWRPFIVRSSAHLLTPPRPMHDRTGWAAIQLTCPDEPASLLLAYRLIDGRRRQTFHLRELQPDRQYSVTRALLGPGDPAAKARAATAAELMRDGLTVEIDSGWMGTDLSAGVWMIQP